MAEILASAVASEGVSRISSVLSGDKVSQESAEDKAERLEMAVLKIQSVVAVSEDLHISHLPLIRWKAKLKRVAVEGDSLLHARKKKILECSGESTTTTGTSLSKYLIHTAKRLVPLFSKEDDEISDTTLRRFERLADGADSFFRLIESSGHPKRSISLPSLTGSLLSGDSVEFCLQGPSSSDHVLLWPDAENELEAFLFVSHEDEVMWQKNFKMIVSFHLSEAANVLAIATSCLELLPPQFGVAGVGIRRLLDETIVSQGGYGRSYLSAKSSWICRVMQSYLRSDCDPNLQISDARMVLPRPVLRLSAFCYASPPAEKEKPCSPLQINGFHLHLACHVSPYLLPERHSSQFVHVEQDAVWEMLPKVVEGFYTYNDQRQAPEYERQIWCPQSAMYCSVAPEIAQPLTLSKAYLMDYSDPRRRRRASHTTPRKRSH